jgi:hypothetical protein
MSAATTIGPARTGWTLATLAWRRRADRLGLASVVPAQPPR